MKIMFQDYSINPTSENIPDVPADLFKNIEGEDYKTVAQEDASVDTGADCYPPMMSRCRGR